MNSEVIELSTDLDVIAQMKPADVFQGGQLDPLLELVAKEVTAEVPDVTTSKGRDRIKSLAYQVARTKTTLDDIGKTLVADMKAQVSAIDAVRRDARLQLDALKAKVRAPLDEWEALEQARVAKLEARVEKIRGLGEHAGDERTSEELQFDLVKLRAMQINRSFQEYQGMAGAERGIAIAWLLDEIPKRKEAEEAAAALEEKRRQEAAEAQAKRDAEIAEQAAKVARQEAEAKAQQEAAEAKAESDRKLREEREAREAAERKERERKARELAEQTEREARQRDESHREECDYHAALAIAVIIEQHIATDDEMEIAKDIVRAISNGIIARVTINY